jgi:DNA-binding NarL/FixJ family response regulator
MRVAIAEDGALFREGLVLLLAAAGHEVVGCVGDGDSLLGIVATEPVDVAILDVRMPPEPEGGLTTAERIRAIRPETGLLLLSHYAETHYLMRVLEIGAERIGYRLKEKVAGVQVLADTLDRIVAGEIVIEPVLAKRLVQVPGDRAGSPVAALSERETDVLRLMAEGRANNAIAKELFVSPKVVEKHIASIFSKLGLPGDQTVHHRRVLAVLAYLRATRIDG